MEQEITFGTKILNLFLGIMVVVLIAILLSVVGGLLLAAVGII
ncbi:hypothetical protein [Maribacter polysiphoniae]|uniref:Uncharacterized protein n=1 Tax=Maribacter polysiphoniae TaxID=429344 RepID=A0A316DYM5_9FLAO|nr:hypothetical protein [Maribacter polysiphoniae]PWK23211.1 hypothetical protein LX92_02541 [Maribacter polysiphoniae]